MARRELILRRADGTVVCERCKLADRPLARLRGLLGREGLDSDEGLLLRPASSVHTFFMRFAIDIAYISKDGQVLKMSHSVPPFRICVAPLRAHYALELPSGSLASSNTRVKDMLRFVEEYGTGETPEPLRATA